MAENEKQKPDVEHGEDAGVSRRGFVNAAAAGAAAALFGAAAGEAVIERIVAGIRQDSALSQLGREAADLMVQNGFADGETPMSWPHPVPDLCATPEQQHDFQSECEDLHTYKAVCTTDHVGCDNNDDEVNCPEHAVNFQCGADTHDAAGAFTCEADRNRFQCGNCLEPTEGVLDFICYGMSDDPHGHDDFDCKTYFRCDGAHIFRCDIKFDCEGDSEGHCMFTCSGGGASCTPGVTPYTPGDGTGNEPGDFTCNQQERENSSNGFECKGVGEFQCGEQQDATQFNCLDDNPQTGNQGTANVFQCIDESFDCDSEAHFGCSRPDDDDNKPENQFNCRTIPYPYDPTSQFVCPSPSGQFGT